MFVFAKVALGFGESSHKILFVYFLSMWHIGQYFNLITADVVVMRDVDFVDCCCVYKLNFFYLIISSSGIFL